MVKIAGQLKRKQRLKKLRKEEKPSLGALARRFRIQVPLKGRGAGETAGQVLEKRLGKASLFSKAQFHNLFMKGGNDGV